MSEYRHTVSNANLTGFAESPQQDIGNAGSPLLNNQLTIQNGIGIAVAASYGKRVFQSALSGVIESTGKSQYEEGLNYISSISKYIGIGVALTPLAAVAAAGVDGLVLAIDTAVENRKIQRENELLVFNRGVLIQKSAGRYYG